MKEIKVVYESSAKEFEERINHLMLVEEWEILSVGTVVTDNKPHFTATLIRDRRPVKAENRWLEPTALFDAEQKAEADRIVAAIKKYSFPVWKKVAKSVRMEIKADWRDRGTTTRFTADEQKAIDKFLSDQLTFWGESTWD